MDRGVRNISFALTTDQVRNRTKTVTRRTNWLTLEPGDLLQPVVKGMGLKKGEHVQKLGGPIRVTRVWREKLGRITFAECALEGFPGMGPSEFVAMFCRHNGGDVHQDVTRIEFEYV